MKFLYNFNKIILINEVDYIGDSIIFFWPFVNAIVDQFPDNEIQVFHPHPNVFNPTQPRVLNKSLISFYEEENNSVDSIFIAFAKSDGKLNDYLKSKGLPAIVKGMVGLDYSSLNMPVILLQNEEGYDYYIKSVGHIVADLPEITMDLSKFLCRCNPIIDKIEIKYRWKNNLIDAKSGFPSLGQCFDNVYEYAKICNETFFGLTDMKMADAQNILVSNISIDDVNAKLFLPSKSSFNWKFNLINLTAGTIKKDVLEEYDSLVIWIQNIASNSLKENIDIYLLADNNFPNLRTDLATQADNLFFLNEDSLSYWTYLIKNAEMVYSIDTGFLHIAHILNHNTYGFGGDVDFWFFRDKIIDINTHL